MPLRRKKKNLRISNADGHPYGLVLYGLHMTPGVAEYALPDGKFRLFISEDTIRNMGMTAAGRPMFVEHNEDFPKDRESLKELADGWITESFFNEADGKHWFKFVLVSDNGIRAYQQGYGLSNAYDFKSIDDRKGRVNGMDYDFEVLDGEYTHVALEKNPRYESIILTPEEFKSYNEEQRASIRRVANANDKKGKTMKRRVPAKKAQKTVKPKFSFFKREKVKNSDDFMGVSVLLPESNVEMTIEEVIAVADQIQGVMNADGKYVCNEDDVVVTEGEDGEDEEITIGELLDRVMELEAKVAELSGDDDDDVENEDDDDEEVDEIENEDDEEEFEEDDAPPKAKAKAKKAKNSDDSRRVTRKFEKPKPRVVSKNQKTKHHSARNRDDDHSKSRSEIGRQRAKSIRNADDRHMKNDDDSNVYVIDTMQSQVERGMNRYGQPVNKK